MEEMDVADPLAYRDWAASYDSVTSTQFKILRGLRQQPKALPPRERQKAQSWQLHLHGPEQKSIARGFQRRGQVWGHGEGHHQQPSTRGLRQLRRHARRVHAERRGG